MNNPPAFPFERTVYTRGVESGKYFEAGMTLRDYFAAKAMQTLIHDWCAGDPKHADAVAKNAYVFSDAMLAEREKKGTE